MKRSLISMMAAALLGGLAGAQVPPPPDVGTAANNRPPILDRVRFEQHLNQPMPLDAQFRDDEGRTVKLGDYFGQRPVILVFNYYQCPMLCSEVLNGLTVALNAMKFTAGKEFEVVAISIDPKETPAMAADAKAKYTFRYGRKGTENGWHFLVGDEAAIAATTKAAGFDYVWDERTQQFAHPSGIIVVTPQGKLAQYYYGIEYSARDLELAMVESSKEHIGTVVDSITLFCYHYDPATGKYGAAIMNVLRAGAALVMLGLGVFMTIMFRRERHGEGHAA